ncbi:hypothetical protein Taro_050550 [Colocasia esculenta]|uniref:Neprosin PEP catalytic domain-containing protein n=1 Tax=Colocasia esculenta TaxID=4460 RepID=A0A843XEA5_COLES|nr:hypothetical protein [Colocasia esculenta]
MVRHVPVCSGIDVELCFVEVVRCDLPLNVLYLSRDKISGNWWVRLQGVEMGYWPKELVPSLAEGATFVDFGGEVAYDKLGEHPSTEMGSGHFPYEGFKKASFIKNVQVVDYTYADNEGCYDVQVIRNMHYGDVLAYTLAHANRNIHTWELSGSSPSVQMH